MNRVKQRLGLGLAVTCHPSHQPRETGLWRTGWLGEAGRGGVGKAGSGQVGGDREQSPWEGGVTVVHPGPPHGDTGADSPAHATQMSGPGQHGQASASRGWVTSQGHLRPDLGRN